jgi:two-component system OmpR family sensor kinase/two-component system sensor histidine kinase BaeS
MLAASVVGGLAFRRIGTPFADIMSATDAIARGDLSVRLRENNRGPLGNLARRFNNMVAELERAEQQRRNMMADIAHELRTPLHIIQGNLEGILDGVYEPPENITATLEETRLLSRLVSDLQTLSLAEAGQLPLHPVRLSAADLLSDVATSFSGEAADRALSGGGGPRRGERDGSHCRLTASTRCCQPDRQRPAVHSSRGSPGPVRYQASPLCREDSGTGIPAEERPIFDRFWRGDRSRSHSGSRATWGWQCPAFVSSRGKIAVEPGRRGPRSRSSFRKTGPTPFIV